MKTEKEMQRIEARLIDFAVIIAILLILSTVNLIGGDLLVGYGKGRDINCVVEAGYSSDKIILKLGCGYGQSDGIETVIYNAYLGKSLKLSDKTRVALNSIVGFSDFSKLENQEPIPYGTYTHKRGSHFNYGAELIAIVNITPKFGVTGGFEYTEYGGFLLKVGVAI